jgi:pyruvate/2-oxoglutarate/acetoin dehydrogenase E1 component
MLLTYFDEITRAMTWLGQKPNTMFVGQSIVDGGTFMSGTVSNVPLEKRKEFPVCESFQMQFSLGLAIAGMFPITIFPRENFLLLGIADLVNMIDKLPAISNYEALPKMIIRTAVGPQKKSHPGHQHIGNFHNQIKDMLDWIDVIEANTIEEVYNIYKYAYERPDNRATLVAEIGDMY